MNIISIKTLKSNLSNIDIKENQLIYCSDTKEAFFDLESKRIQIGFTIQLDSDIDRNKISIPLKNKLYIVTETNKLYRYNKNWIEVELKEDVLNLITAAQELIPTTIVKKGVKYAPKTTARNVYMNNGETVEEALERLRAIGTKTKMFTRTEFVVASHNYQKTFNIPFPITNYDLKNFPIIAIAKGRHLKPKEYKLTTSQLILKDDELMKDDIMTFIFIYAIDVSENDIEATTINGVRIFAGTNEILDKREGDLWFDINNKIVKQYMNGKWETVIDPGVKQGSVAEDSLSSDVAEKLNNASEKSIEIYKYIQKIKNTVDNLVETSQKSKIGFEQHVVKLTKNASIVEIPVEFDKSKDSIIIFRNSTFMDNTDYTITKDSKYIKCTRGDIWMGREEPITFVFVIFRGF